MKRGEELYNKLVAIILSINPLATETECEIAICKALGVDYSTM